MSTFYVNVSNAEISKALKSIGIFDGKARMAASRVLRNATRRVATGAKRRVAVRSGELKRSIKSSYSDDRLEGTVKAQTPYAHLVEFGARGAMVKPKKRKALKLGNDKYANKAILPPRKAKPFIIPAFEAETPRIVIELKEAIQKGS